MEGLVRAAVAHLWFETLHPFDDGNGRLARAILQLALGQDMGQPGRRLFTVQVVPHRCWHGCSEVAARDEVQRPQSHCQGW